MDTWGISVKATVSLVTLPCPDRNTAIWYTTADLTTVLAYVTAILIFGGHLTICLQWTHVVGMVAPTGGYMDENTVIFRLHGCKHCHC